MMWQVNFVVLHDNRLIAFDSQCCRWQEAWTGPKRYRLL